MAGLEATGQSNLELRVLSGLEKEVGEPCREEAAEADGVSCPVQHAGAEWGGHPTSQSPHPLSWLTDAKDSCVSALNFELVLSFIFLGLLKMKEIWGHAKEKKAKKETLKCREERGHESNVPGDWIQQTGGRQGSVRVTSLEASPAWVCHQPRKCSKWGWDLERGMRFGIASEGRERRLTRESGPG